LKAEVVEFLENRMVSAWSIMSEGVSAESSLEDILEALEFLDNIIQDSMIHYAATQIILYKSIQRQSSNPKRHLQILRELAKKKGRIGLV
jgi:hypothetical protein